MAHSAAKLPISGTPMNVSEIALFSCTKSADITIITGYMVYKWSSVREASTLLLTHGGFKVMSAW